MTTSAIRLDIVSAEKEIFSGMASMIFVSGQMGELGIAPGHTPLLTSLKPGNVEAKLENGTEEVFYISGGMLEVQPYVVTVLADTALRAHDIDEASAMEAKARAEQALLNKVSEVDYARATAELAEALAQLRTIRRLRKQAK